MLFSFSFFFLKEIWIFANVEIVFLVTHTLCLFILENVDFFMY